MIKILTNQLLKKINKERIVCIGDSHAYFLKNVPYFEIQTVGPATAYNLITQNSTTKSREKCFEILNHLNSEETALLFSFGEIDLRVHVIKAAKNSNGIFYSVLQTLNRYIQFIEEICNLGWTIIIQGPCASGFEEAYNLEFPYFGSMKERNIATTLFNENLKKYCKNSKIPFGSLYDLCIEKETLNTIPDFFSDGCHLKHDICLESIIISRFISSVDFS